ncbi:Hpt domain-containing protein [Picosynechococcus sp. NKBG042902]|uniref:Hpt domain-containing protein n=1 Tax=Picosynechococcus sp. NKBG042902 TaxID=490193 RepID=UPI0004AA0270|nr:Hpt domain-containing protein [Picosynechococcus sp. NKBG042902]
MASSSAADEVNLEQLAEMVSYDLATLQDLVETFLGDTPLLIAAMQTGYEQHNQAELVRNAHTLKSSSRLFQMEQFARQCQALEGAAHAEDWPRVATLLQQLGQDYQAIAAALTLKLTQLMA